MLKDYLFKLLPLSPVILIVIINLFLVNSSFVGVSGINFWESHNLEIFNFIIFLYILIILTTAYYPRQSNIFKAVYFPNYLITRIFSICIIGFLIMHILGFIAGYNHNFEPKQIIFIFYYYAIFVPFYFYLLPIHLLVLCLAISFFEHNLFSRILCIVCFIGVLCSLHLYYNQLNFFMDKYGQGLVI